MCAHQGKNQMFLSIKTLFKHYCFKVSKNDGLPTSLCTDCLTKLNAAYVLRKQIILADIKLRETQNIQNKPTNGRVNRETEKKQCNVSESLLHEEDTNNCENGNDYSDYSSEDDIPLVNRKKIRSTKRKYGNKAKLKRTKEKLTYSCNECQKTFKNRYYFEVHNTKHTGFKPYMCDVCKKGFSMRWVLNMHSRVHTGVKPYSCDVCGKLFRFASALPNHMRIHTGVRPYKCDICGKSFTQIGGLKVHQRTHTGEKPYVCEICSKGFSEFASLNRHVRTHKNERNYPCPTCGKCFSDPSHVHRHLKTHSGEKPYSCEVCNIIYLFYISDIYDN